MKRAEDLLMRFWRELHEQGIPYCVVGDSRALPARVQSDVDMVVPDQHLERMPELVMDFCQKHGLHLVQRLVHERTAVYLVIAWLGTDGIPGFLALDFCSHYMRAGRRLLTPEELLESRVRAKDERGAIKGFYVAGPALEFIYYLLKKIDKGGLDIRHGEHLSAQWARDPEGAAEQVARFWPRARWRRLLSDAAGSGNWELVRQDLPRLRRALRRRHGRSWSDGFHESVRKVRRWWRPTGMTVAVLGGDGSGKSALIELLRNDWAPAFRKVRYAHLRPRLFARRAGASATVSDPHGRKPRGTLASTLKLGWFVFDFVAGYAFRIRPWMARSALVIFDRYFDDLYLDPKRYRFGARREWALRASRFVPRPHLWLVLDASPDTLQARKQEVSREVSGLQQRAYRGFCDQRGTCEPIDANPPLAEVRAQVNERMLEVLRQRAAVGVQRTAWTQSDNPATAKLLVAFCRWNVPVLSRLVRVLFNSDIYCKLPWPPSLPHPYGIIIHSQARIGRGVTIMQQVTIGGKHGSDQAPVIDDNVYIGAGAKVLGGIRIGLGAVIGANAVVTKDVPAGAIAVGANRLLEHSGTQSADESGAGRGEVHHPPAFGEAGDKPREGVGARGPISFQEGS